MAMIPRFIAAYSATQVLSLLPMISCAAGTWSESLLLVGVRVNISSSSSRNSTSGAALVLAVIAAR